MDNLKNDLYFVRKIQEDLAFIIKHMKDVDEEELAHNELLQDSMMFRLIQISENARKLSDGFRLSEHPNIPWIAMFGLRNRIVHDYGSVDLGIVFDTLKNSIPELYYQLNEEFEKTKAMLRLMCELQEGRRSGEEGYVSSADVRAYFRGKRE